VNVALSGVVQQLLGTTVLLAAAALFLHRLPPTIGLMPLLLIPQLLVTVGVFIRDMPQFNQLSFSTWMYLTPILYPESQIPAKNQWRIQLNPMAPLVRGYRRVLLEGKAPDWRGLGVTMHFALLCFGIGYWWFERTKKAFADVL
jgi:lipopolysaccharide transport system permease protein